MQLVRSKYTYKFKKAATTPGLVYWKPRTPGLRHKISIDYDALGIYTGAPHQELAQLAQRSGGRNNHGRITTRHRGGGDPKVLRDVDFSRKQVDGVPGVIERLELDPNRSAFLALVKYAPEGQLPFYRYHIAPADVKPGDVMLSGKDAPVRPGSTLKLRDIPIGVAMHGIELRPGGGGQLARAAHTCAMIQSKSDEHAIVKLPSGETRMVGLDCRATVGLVSNHLQKMTNYGKAGARRKLGWRPSVRGIAMNPIDHPHGGRGNGGRPSCTPWGVYTKGKRTRRRNKVTNRFILFRAGGVPIEKFVQAKKWRAAVKAGKRAANQPRGAVVAGSEVAGPGAVGKRAKK